MKPHKYISFLILGAAVILLCFSSCKPDLKGTITTDATSFYPGMEVSEQIEVLLIN